MNCDKYREILDQYFGQSSIPEELREHLRSCMPCTEYEQELNRLRDGLGTDDDFLPENLETELFVSSVEKQLPDQASITLISPGWRKILTVLAAALVVTATSVISFRMGGSSARNEMIASGGSSSADVVSVETDQRSASMDADMAGIIMYNYVSNPFSTEPDSLIGELNEEEFEYLEANLNVGDLLL